MELDIIKSQTTWNDAVGGINSNFAKIKAAFATVGTGGGGGLNEDELRLFLEQNGYTTEEWVKLQKYLTIDSADSFFARKDWVVQQMTPYAKSVDVANTYATIAALDTLQGSHDALRQEFDALNNLLSSDTEDYINTWNEVVAFLDGYKDESDLATILSGMNADISSRLLASDFESWKTNTFTPLANLVANHTTRLDGLDQSILSINTRIDGVDKTIEDHIAEFIAFRANFEITDNLILVRKNFASTEEVSAKGINQGTGGGGGSSYSRLDTWEGYDNNKAGYVLSAGLGYGLKVAVDELNGYDLDNRVSAIENSYVSKDAGGVVNGGLVVSSLAVSGGSSSQFLKADGSLDGTSYLPTSGGTITGTLIKRTTGQNYITFADSIGNTYGYLGFNGANTPMYIPKEANVIYTLYHSGNFNPSDYLPTSGGVITGYPAYLTLRASSISADSWLQFTDTETSDIYAIGLRRPADMFGLQYRINTDYYDILHSGNVGNYALKTDGSNTMNGGIKWTLNPTPSSWDSYFDVGGNRGLRILNNVGHSTEGAPSNYAVALAVSGYYGFALAYDANGSIFKAKGYDSTDWKTLAFAEDVLSTSGGTINGYFGAFSVKRYEPYSSAIKFENSVGILGYIGISDDYTPLIWDKDLNARTLIHSGNIGRYNAGGLVEEFLDDLNNATGGRFFISGFQAANRPNGAVNFGTGVTFKYSDIGAIYQLAYDTYGGLYSRYKVNNSWSNWKTIAFTDSDITGNAATATYASNAGTLGGYDRERIRSYVFGGDYREIADGTDLNELCGETNCGIWNSKDNTSYVNAPMNNFGLMSIRLNSIYFGQLVFPYESTLDHLKYRSEIFDASINWKRWTEWRELAFLDDNVASAQALKHSNGTVGATVDEQGRILSSGYGVAATNRNWQLLTAGYCGDFGATNSDGVELYSLNGVLLSVGEKGLILNSAGNVLIGTTTDNGAKLQVNGGITTKGYIDVTEQNSSNVFTLTTYSNIARIYAYDGTNDVYRDIYIGQNSGNALVVTGGGNVGIGTPDPSERLDVNGNTRVRGDIVTERIIIGGVTLSTEDGVLKIESDMYATGEISAHGLNKGESGGGGSSYSRLDAWGDYDSSKAGYVLSAGLGYDLNTRLSSLSGVVDTHTSRLSSLENAGYITSSVLSGYLPTNGGTISNGIWAYQLNLNALNTDAGLRFSINGALKGLLRVDSNQDLWYQGASENLLLHSGNVGDYAVIYLSNATIDLNEIRYGSRAGKLYNSSNAANAPAAYRGFLEYGTDGFVAQFNSDNQNNLFYRWCENGTWLPWKTIAFTDSNVAGAQKLVDGSGNPIIHNNGSIFYIGDTIYPTIPTNILGSEIVLRYGASATNGLILDSSGNVTVGNGYFAGGGTKLYVDGGIRFAPRTIWGQNFDGTGDVENPAKMQILRFVNTDGSTGSYIGRGATNHNGIFVYISTEDDFSIYTKGEQRMLITPAGNVLIGTTSDNGAKLQVDGSLSAGDTTLSSLTVSGNTSLSYVNVSNEIKVDGGYGFFRKDISGNIADILSYQHYLPIEIGRKSNDMCIAMGVTADDYAVIQSKGIGITNQGKLSINPQGGDIYLGGFTWAQSTYTPAVTIANDGNVSIVKDLSVSGLSTFTGGVATNDIHGNGQSLYLGNAGNNAYIKVREDMSGVDGAWSIPRNGNVVFNTLTVNGASLFRASVAMEAAVVLDSTLTVNGATTLSSLNAGASTLVSLTVTNGATVGSLTSNGNVSGLNIYASSNLSADGTLTIGSTSSFGGIVTVGGASIHPTANSPYFQLYQNNNYWYWQADDNYTYIGGTMSKALRIDQDGNTLIRGSLGVDALLTASNGLTVSKGISATDGIVSDWITAANITANTSASIAALTVSGLSTLTGGIATNDIHGNGQSLYLGNASNNAYIKVRENMVGSSSMWSIPRDGKATFTSLTTPTLSVTESATIASVIIEAGNATLSNLTVNTAATLKQLVVGIDGMSCNAPATFNDFIYGSSITPRTDNYYVLGNNNYKWYAVTAYNVNVHDAITIEAGKELRFKDDNGVVHTLRYDSTKQAFVFDGNVNATGEVSAKRLNA